MITQNETESSVISSEAMGLLDGFVAELGDAIYEIAEELARERSAPAGSASAPVQIEAADVRRAAAIVLQSIRSRVDAGDLPQQIVPAIEEMKGWIEQPLKH